MSEEIIVKWLDGSEETTEELNFGTITVYPVTQEGGSAEKEFYIKNSNESISTMEEVVVKFSGEDEEAVGWKQVKKATDAEFSDELSISDLAPGDTSVKLVARTQVPYDASVGDHVTKVTVDYIYS